ncbi:MAG TPA: hypothetical protein VIG99_18500, partial [Myxococcaceae bacterium]
MTQIPSFHLPRGSEGRPGWITRADATPTRDVTRRFLELTGLAAHDHPVLPPGAAGHGYLVIGGLFGKHMPGYMRANLEALKRYGLDARLVPVDSDASVQENAKTVRRAILGAATAGRRLVLIGHSKGGVDAAAALSMYPDLKAAVLALVAIQSPFGGSPIAQDIQSTPLLQPVVNQVIKDVLRGDPQSVKDLTYDARERFLAEHPLPLDVPAVCVATSRLDVGSVLVASQDYLWARYGYLSDGLVVPEDAVL